MSPWKQLLLSAYYHGTLISRRKASRIRSRQGSAPVMVLFYHRVADACPNPWTMSTRAFQRQIRWLTRHYELVSLAEAQRRLSRRRNSRPCVSITFDDGYADNCDFALPLLAERRIPCTYFVSTDHVLRAKPFSHDVQRGQPLKPNTPDQLRWMREQGIEIGCHTRTHADLGQLSDPHDLHAEVVEARQELETVTGSEVRYFAFPYGLHANLSARAFQLARIHGYQGVCSAYGGYNFPGDDPFHLQRIHADPQLIRLKNWLTVDPRKLATIARFNENQGVERRRAGAAAPHLPRSEPQPTGGGG